MVGVTTSRLPGWVELFALGAVGAVVALAGGAVVGLGGVPGMILLLFVAASVAAIAIRQELLVGAVLGAAAAILLDWYPFPLPVRYIFHPDFAFAFAGGLALVHLFRRKRAEAATSARVSSRLTTDATLPNLRIWLALLAIGLYPGLHAISLVEGARYYLSILGNSALFYFVGIQLGREPALMRRLFNALTFLASLLALHSVIEALTGIFLFSTPAVDTYLLTYGSFALPGLQLTRAGSFLLNPDWNGTFMATMVFVGLGLFSSATSSRAKTLHLSQVVLLLLGLVFTYSTGSLISFGAGLLVFLTLVGQRSARNYLLGIAVAFLVAIAVLLPDQVSSLVGHATSTRTLSIRLGLWQTALNIIFAHPFTGIGFGLATYMQRSALYFSDLQDRPFAHPHDSYLELAAMGGLLVLSLFLILLIKAYGRMLRNRSEAAWQERALLAGICAAIAALAVNALSINAWTIAPIATIAWLMLGAASAPRSRPARTWRRRALQPSSDDEYGAACTDEAAPELAGAQ